ncbi:MAG: hypothetical protein MUO77_10025 [Anaerolineales bacterium]|nr:hypothetical protein [Anaerolineales bacterium]
MLIPITVLVLFIAALALVILRVMRPDFRPAWLIAVGSALLAWLMIFFWQLQMPISFQLPPWQPASLFADSPSFLVDGLSWPYALSILSLTLAVLLTAVARENFPDPFTWAGILILSGISLLAVTAGNPLSLVMVWAAIDIAELITQLRSVDTPQDSERVVIAFSTRAVGMGLLLWANIVSINAGARLDFLSMPAQAGLYLVAAAGLRLGVLPLRLPYTGEAALRRGFGTMIRLTSVASSLVLLARIPAGSVNSPVTIFMLVLTTLAAIYSGWMWLRAPNELTGRPFWIIGMSALAVSAALQANPVAAVAWGCALILAGGALFLISVQQTILSRVMLIGAWGISALPFSLTASAWTSTASWLFPFLILAQAMLTAGWVRHVLRPATHLSYEFQAVWARGVYLTGIGLLLFTIIFLGLFGWDGSLQLGAWAIGLIASLLTFGLVWAMSRIRTLNPARAHWIQPANSSWLERAYRVLWDLYRQLGQITQTVTTILEGNSGIMWTLLFLALFVSLMAQRNP